MRRTARAVGIAGSLLILATTAAPVFGASHREAPLTAANAATDHTDVYAWVDGNDATKVNFVVNVSPMQDPAGGPNFWQFDPNARYTIKIDNDRDAKADITYRFTFKTKVRNQGTFLYNTNQVTGVNDADLNVRQTYTVTRIKENGDQTVLGRDLPTSPTNVGPRSNPSYATTAAGAVKTLPGGYKAFAGQRDDPFFVDLGSIFDLGGLRPFNSAHVIPLADSAGIDDLQANNVLTIAFQVPIKKLTKGGQIFPANDNRAVLGIWAANFERRESVRTLDGKEVHRGPWRQVSRMANPLINEVIIPRGLKDKWNATHPSKDFEVREVLPEAGTRRPGELPVPDPPRCSDDGADRPLADPAPGHPGREQHGSRSCRPAPPQHGHRPVHRGSGRRRRGRVPPARCLL